MPRRIARRVASMLVPAIAMIHSTNVLALGRRRVIAATSW